MLLNMDEVVLYDKKRFLQADYDVPSIGSTFDKFTVGLEGTEKYTHSRICYCFLVTGNLPKGSSLQTKEALSVSN